jgi:hypothetical protein
MKKTKNKIEYLKNYIKEFTQFFTDIFCLPKNIFKVSHNFVTKLKKGLLVLLNSLVIAAWLFSPFAPKSVVGPKPVKEAKAAATYQFTPTSGRIVRGVATSTQALLAAAAEGVNMGSWKGTLADDNMHWVVVATSSTPTGFDVQLDMAGVNLNNANRFMIETGFDLDSLNNTTAQVPQTFLQICDWVSSLGVNNAADSNCTTGGWRTLNMRSVPVVATATESSLHYEIYDGYFSDGNNGSYSTPLANFINTSNSNTVTFRYYSDTATNQNIAIDFLRLYSFVSPTYTPGAAQPMINGSATNTPGGLFFVAPTTSNIPYDTDMNNQFIYTVGNNATPDWYIEKRWKSGALDSSVTSAAGSRDARSLAIDSTYMYVVGDDQGPSWRIEKRVLGSGSAASAFGALDLGFGTSGVVTSASGTAMRIATDQNSMYVVGGSVGDWRIEKRKLASGTLDTTFGVSGVVTGAAATATSTAVYLDNTYMYVVGSDTSGWRIEKRLKTTGALCTGGACGTDFDTDGIITGVTTGVPYAITSDGSGSIYITGNDGSNNWRMEKRDVTTGALDASFGSSTGVVTSAAASNVAYGINISGSNVYVVGDDGSDWRVEKRNISTGDLVNGFGSSGVLTGTSTSVTAYSVEDDGTSLYISGTQTGTDWRYEKINISDGLPASGYGYLLGDILNVNSPTAGSSDNVYLSATSTATYPVPDFFMKFKNIRSYTGMNSMLFRPEISCSATTPDITYSFSVYNNSSSSWESITGPIDCSTTDSTQVFSKYTGAAYFSNYVNGSSEIWLRMNFSTSSINSNLRIDQMYMVLGTVNEDTNSSAVTFGTQTAGRVTNNPSSPGADRILDTDIDGTYLYTVGFDNVGGDDRWRVEKRSKTTGALDTSFGTGGVVTSDPTANSDQAQAIAQDGTYMYVAGYSGTSATNFDWRLEKRNISDGALVSAFGTNGVITSAPSSTASDIIYDVKVDASSIYLIGQDMNGNGQWRVEKRDIVTGSLCDNSPGTECGSAGTFGTAGVYTVNPSANNDIPYDAVILGANLYIVGQDAALSSTNFQWRVQAITTAAGAATAGFGTGGATTTNFSANADIPFDIETDGTSLFIGGYDGIVSGTDFQMRIMKMNTSGNSVAAFGTLLGINYNPSATEDRVTRMRYYSSKVYFTGFQSTTGIWYTKAIDSTTAATSTFNGTTGLALSDDSGDDRANALEVEASGVYVAGFGTGPGNNQWMIEKRDPTTGLLDSTFGGSGVSGTRSVNYTDQNNRESWNIQAAEESNNFANDFYAFDNDATSDATIEEAKAATLDFTVTVPTSASVVSNFYAANFNAGASGTVRFGLRDYSGFTGTVTGGRILIGPTGGATNAMTYDDYMESALLMGNSGYNGVLTNPEDNIDTKRNVMSMSFVTTAAAATTTKATMMIDFAMVSIGWVDTSPPVSNTITVSGTFYETDETTPYATSTPMKLAVNGTVSYTASAVSGSFSFTSVNQPTNGDILTIWLNSGGGVQATLVFDYGSLCTGGNCTGLSLYKNSVIIDSKNSSTLLNSSLASCDNSTGSACSDTDIGFTSNANDLTLTWLDNTLRLPFSTSQYSPGGKITAKNFKQSSGSFNGGNALLTFDGDFSVLGGVATSTTGSLRVGKDIIRSGSGIFNHNNGDVVLLSPWLDTTISGMGTSSSGSFYNLRIDIPDKTVKIAAGENLLINNYFLLHGQPGAINKIMSTSAGVKWYINVASSSLVNWAGVADSGCVLGTNNPFVTPEARDFGNNGPCWRFIKFGGGGGGNAGGPPPPPPDDLLGGGGGGNQQGGGGLGGGQGGGPPPCPPDDLQCQPGGGGGGGGQSGGSEGGGGGGAAP